MNRGAHLLPAVALALSCLLVVVPVQGARTSALTGTLVDGLRLVDLASGSERRVRAVDPTCITDKSLMSPDGRRIAFTCESAEKGPNNLALRVIGVDGKNERILLDHLGGIGFVWSPDSSFIALKTGQMAYGIQILDADGQGFWQLPVQIEGAMDLGGSFFYWLSDGKSFAVLANFDKTLTHFGLFKIKIEVPLDAQRVSDFKTMGQMSLAPDEKHLGYIPWSLTQLIISDLLGVNRLLIHHGAKSHLFMFWSPDSQWIGAKQERPNRTEVGTWTVWNIATKVSVDLPVPYSVFHLQWWGPQTVTPPDCDKIVRDALGPGEKLER